jgi:hypothetical protein
LVLGMQATPVDKLLVEDALRIVETARKKEVTLRLLGALAITLHSPEFSTLHRGLKRLGDLDRAFTDIDLMGYGKQRVKVREIMEDDLEYSVDQSVLLFRGKERLLYHHPEGRYNVDIFFDSLHFSHDISFGTDLKKGRLSLDYPTITPTDLLLEKLQIHTISEKDLKDIIVLVRAHELKNSDELNDINIKHVAATLSDDWGFWKDATSNLRDVVAYAEKYRAEGMLPESDFSTVSDRILMILSAIESETKTMRWKLRERTGKDKQWWNSVEEVSR